MAEGVAQLVEPAAAAVGVHPALGEEARGRVAVVEQARPAAIVGIGRTPIENLFVNCGWGTGGFKATPASGWVYAHTIARGEPHELNAAFSLERFETGALIDEHGAAAVAH